MDFKTLTIVRAQQVEVGSLFVLLHPKKGPAICLRAAYQMPPEEADEANRVIPLHWAGNEEVVGMTVYASAMTGDAMVLDQARLEVDPLSAGAGPLGRLDVIYGRDDRLFFPLRHNGEFGGLVDAGSGRILDSTSGNYLAFEKWTITVPDDRSSRRSILSASGPSPTSDTSRGDP